MPEERDPGRRSLPHLPSREFPNQSIIQYLTVNVASRRPLLARREVHELLVKSWREAGFWLVGRYVIMPDHVHLFCTPGCWPPTPLKQWVQCWRANATRGWPHPQEKPIWQRDFFDRQLQSGESYRAKWSYLRENPVKAGLVPRADDWPYQGELNVLSWHEAD